MFLYLLLLLTVLLLIMYQFVSDRGQLVMEHLDNPLEASDDSENEKVQTEELKYYKKLLSEKKVSAGPRGPAGPRGATGPAGGAFSNQGPLRSTAYPQYYLDRLWGTGVNAAAYLAKPNYSAHQVWTLRADRQLANQFGMCLKGDTISGDVYMNKCGGDVPDPDQQWRYTNWGQLRLQGDMSQCLTVKKTAKFSGGKQIDGAKPSGGSTHPDILQTSLTKCQNDNVATDQQWSFY